MKPIDPATARDEAITAFEIAFSFRGTDAIAAIVTYLDARLAYYQAALVDATADTTSIQQQARFTRDLRIALTADDGVPRSIV